MTDDSLTEEVIGAAIEVHRTLGPGLLESVYEDCLAFELGQRGVTVERQRDIAVNYKGHRLAASLRLDLLVEGAVVVEVKSVESLSPVHQAQLLTYLRLSKTRIGLLINFNVPVLKDGIKRMAN